MQKYDLQLVEGIGGYPRGPMVMDTGGVVFVATAGDASKATLTDASGAALANPVSLSNGGCTFYVANSVSSVDLYVMAPGGQFVVRKAVKPGAEPEIAVDVSVRNQVAVIPFSMTDATAAAEYDTGFNEPSKALFSPNVAIDVLTVDATETINVGTDSTDSGDANGFMAAVSVAAAGLVKATLANGAMTLGALLFVQDSANAGDEAPESHVSASKSITYTLTAGSDTAEGFIILPYVLAG